MNIYRSHVVGIDYSMNSPAVCVFDLKNGILEDFSSFSIFYTDDRKSSVFDFPNIHHIPLQHQKSSPEKRFDWLSSWVLKNVPLQAVIFLEGYSMGSKGNVFHIGENTGVLKYKLAAASMPINLVPPTVLKKYAYGKGNADKNKMYEAFLSKTKINLFGQKKCPSKIGSPYSDIVDAYFLCCYGLNTLNIHTTNS